MLRSQALELFFSDSHELLLNFPGGVKDRERFYTKLRHSCKVRLILDFPCSDTFYSMKKIMYNFNMSGANAVVDTVAKSSRGFQKVESYRTVETP